MRVDWGNIDWEEVRRLAARLGLDRACPSCGQETLEWDGKYYRCLNPYGIHTPNVKFATWRVFDPRDIRHSAMLRHAILHYRDKMHLIISTGFDVPRYTFARLLTYPGPYDSIHYKAAGVGERAEVEATFGVALQALREGWFDKEETE